MPKSLIALFKSLINKLYSFKVLISPIGNSNLKLLILKLLRIHIHRRNYYPNINHYQNLMNVDC